MVDEMDLLSRLKAAEPIRPGAFDEARAVLRAAMAMDGAPETKAAPGGRARSGRRRTAGISLAALGAAAAAVALVVTSASAPGHNPGASGKPSVNPAPTAANPVLAKLAADITARPVRLPGNATLEIRNQSPTSDKLGGNGIDLYTDNGTYYWGISRSDLRQEIASHQVEGEFKRALAAALIAANGDIARARAKMAVAGFIPGVKVRQITYGHRKPLTPEQRKEHVDNLIWMNSLYALTAVPGNAKVRAGVLAIMATMPNVKVTHTTTAGQLTLTVADSWPKLGPRGLVESLVINASTGLPVALFNRGPGQPLNATYYHTVRVTVADVEAGRF